MTFPRASGVLLHPTSLPGPHGCGDFGPAAFHFVDWLVAAGQKLWQILPLGGIGPGNSPYMSSSAFAGNLLLIDLADLARHGWLDEADLLPDARFSDARVDFSAVIPWRMARLEKAAARFAQTTAAVAAAPQPPGPASATDPAAQAAQASQAAPENPANLANPADQANQANPVNPTDQTSQASQANPASSANQADFANFCAQQADWLDDYALFMTLADLHGWRDWCDWPAPLARRDPQALRDAARAHAAAIAFWKFAQWRFFRQWQQLRAYANGRGIKIIGDAPIFIACQSAEVWANQALFELDAQGRPSVVAGVPPDYFSATGQRWGNPLYRWSAHAADGYAWWITRVRRTFELVDIVRIDHFRGFAAYWEIPADEPTAIHGRWRPGPGAALFAAVEAALGALPIIAEDLGVITPDVDALRRQFALPGMRILHFAFGEDGSNDSTNPYLPHNFERNTVVYTGTHDNNTTLGWWHEAAPALRQHVLDYLGSDGARQDGDDPSGGGNDQHGGDDSGQHGGAAVGQGIHWQLIRAACASVADTAIYPLQDVLGLDASHRMNLPGKGEGHWEWRFRWAQVKPEHARQLAHLCILYRRD